MRVHQKGCKSELLVTSNLISHDYQVYKPVDSQGPYDLLVKKDEKCYTIEVKSVNQFNKTKAHWRNAPDILTQVNKNGVILYLPKPRFGGT
jgi:DNA-binding sugar fermentation-stimulating protein